MSTLTAIAAVKKCVASIGLIAVVALVGATAAAAAAKATVLCVGGQHCYPTLQAAVTAAHDGDTIQLKPGTYAGGVTIGVSVRIVGAGAQATTIRGGGPVLMIGTFLGTNTQTVSISGVTITGGFNNTQPSTQVASGGGIWIPVGANQSTGDTVTISDSVITGNTVTPSDVFPPSGFCGGTPCAFVTGGGIDNGGTLTLTNTRVTGNIAGGVGSLASQPFAAGILNRNQGTLTMQHCIVSGNQAIAGPPNGNGAHDGGIESNGQLTISDSVVSGNSVVLVNALPSQFDDGAFAGGIEVGDGVATITNTLVSGNTVTANNAGDGEYAYAGGILAEGTLNLSNSSVDHNQLTVNAASDVFTDGGGLEIDGVANINNTLIVSNSITATTATGQAFGQGGGIANVGQATLQRTLVLGNTITVKGTGGLAQGGGIWNSTFNPGDPVPQLTLIGSAVAGNRINASAGITPQGGGVFTTAPVTLTRTLVAGNSPDQLVNG